MRHKLLVNNVAGRQFRRVSARGEIQEGYVMKLPKNVPVNVDITKTFDNPKDFLVWKNQHGIILMVDNTVAMKDEKGNIIKPK